MRLIISYLLCFGAFHTTAQNIGFKILKSEHQKAYDEAENLWKQGRPAEAVKLAGQLIETIEATEPAFEQDKIQPLLLKARCLLQMRAPVTSVDSIFQTIRQIGNGTLTTSPGQHANLLLKIGSTLDEYSQYHCSEKYFLEAIDSIPSNSPDNYSQLAETLQLTGAHYYRAQDYENAEIHYLRAQTLWEHYLDTTSLDYSDFLNYMASLHKILGRYELAEHMYLKCLSIRERIKGPQDFSCAQPLVNLAQVCQLRGELTQAEQYFLKALPIRRANKARDPARYALTINNYATLLRDMKRFDEAESYFRESIDIRSKSFNNDFISSLNGLATLYKLVGRYADSDSLYRVCLAARDTLLGKESPDYLLTLRNMIDLHARMGQFGWVDAELAQEMKTLSAVLHKNMRFLSEKDLTALSAHYERALSLYLSFCLVRQDDIRINSSICYNHALLYKGFVLNAGQSIRSLSFEQPEAQQLYTRFMNARAEIAYEYARPAKWRSGKLSVMEAQADKLENELAHQVANFLPSEKLITWRDVQTRLEPQSAAIEFVEFLQVFPRVTDTVMYAALVLLPGKQEPGFIPLCTKKELNDLISRQTGPAHQRINGAYAATQAQGSANLFQLLWAPLEPALKKKNVRTVYYSPAGLIHRINLMAISVPGDESTILADAYRFVPMESTRRLALPAQVDHSDWLKDAVVYGGVNYRIDSAGIDVADASFERPATNTSGSGESSALRSSYADADTTPYLPGTYFEAIFIDSLLLANGIHSEKRLGYSATEAAFKMLGVKKQSPALLHIGTHGFFSEDVSDSICISRAGADDISVFELSDQPLMRCGLKLAGVDDTRNRKLNPKGIEDGMLTALEVSHLNLSGTRLAFLSACETGLGTINGNEGVYGLQRAFRLAGVKNLIISLWRVSDKATSKLVKQFYINLIAKKMPARAAFEKAQSWLREQPGFEQPYFWAGFMFSGENH